MAGERKYWVIPRYAVVLGVMLLGTAVTITTVLAIQDRTDRRLTAEIERTQSELLGLGARITAIKDADLTSANDYIAAYAQIEPLQREYDEKLQRFSDLYNDARERDSHRGLLDLRRWRSKHHPETWDKMAEIIGLVRQINEITKREGAVIHCMASLPDAERVKYWHEQFMPLAAQEHALREQLQILGQGAHEQSLH